MKLPSFDEMVQKLNGASAESEEVGNLSTDQKIDEIFKILKEAQCEAKAEGVEEAGEVYIPTGGGGSGGESPLGGLNYDGGSMLSGVSYDGGGIP